MFVGSIPNIPKSNLMTLPHPTINKSSLILIKGDILTHPILLHTTLTNKNKPLIRRGYISNHTVNISINFD